MVYSMLLESAEAGDPERFKETDLYLQCVAAGVIPAGEEDLRRIAEREKQETHATEASIEGVKATSDPSDTLAMDLIVDGMWCAACAWVIEKTVNRLTGVEEVTCHFSTDRMRCRYRPDSVAPDQIRASVTRLGYGIREADTGAAGQRAQRREWIRLTITGLLSANVMMLSWALYAGFFTSLSSDAISKISLPIVAMAAVVLVYGGGPMLRKAWFGLIHRAPGMETLVGMAAGCAFVYSLYTWLTGSIHLYFDTACMLITLVLLGKILEQQAKSRVRRDLDSFFALQPTKVRLITDASPTGRYVAIGQLAAGERFAVASDEIVPADGRVESGTATLDESSLTGEPRPVGVKTGDPIKSGARVIDGRVTARVEKVGDDTVLGQMIAIMTRSLEQKSVFEGRTDRLLKWFVPMIITLAGGTGLFCAMTGLPVNQAVVRAVTVMVISCPCALGVAIPMARLAGISLAARRGILVREIESFERAASIDSVVFDKTGTLTHGRWRLSHIECQPGYVPATIAAWAAGLEQSSDHEVARAIITYAHTQAITPAAATDIIVHPDGVQGRLDDKIVRIGNRGFAWGKGLPAGDVTEESEATLTSRVFLSVDNRPAATLIFGDTIRPAVASMVDALKRTSREIHLVSGDGDAATREVARTIGLNQARGNLLPSDKARLYRYVEGTRATGGHGGRRHQRCGSHGPGPSGGGCPFRSGAGQGSRPHHPHARRSRPTAGLFPSVPAGQSQRRAESLVCLDLQPDQHPRRHERAADPPDRGDGHAAFQPDRHRQHPAAGPTGLILLLHRALTNKKKRPFIPSCARYLDTVGAGAPGGCASSERGIATRIEK